MKFLPYDEFQFVVPLPPWEVSRKLVENVSESTFWNFFSFGDKKFQGNVQELKFKIHRSIYYRNSFLPILHGELEGTEGGTKITVKMKLHKFVLLLLLVWSIWSLLPSPSSTSAYFICFAILITYAGFWAEVSKSKSTFQSVFANELSKKDSA